VKGFPSAFWAVSGLVFVGLATNLLVAVVAAPFWALALAGDLRATWPWAAIAALLLGPAVMGANAVFTAYTRDGDTGAVRAFWRGWRGTLRRVMPAWLALWVFLIVVGTDLYAMRAWGLGSLALPVCGVLIALALVTALTAGVGLAERPDLARFVVVKAAVYLSVRRPGWSLVSAAVLAVVARVVWVSPLLGLGVLTAPALYVIWGNARRVLARFIREDAGAADEAVPVVGLGRGTP